MPFALLFRSRLFGAGIALVVLAGCRSTPEPDPVPAPAPDPAFAPIAAPGRGPAVPATWTQNLAALRGRVGTRVVYECRPNPGRQGVGTVWGTDVYSDDSSLCAAAVHAGVLTFEQGGRALVTVLPGAEGYDASTRNGVESSRWGRWSGSFSVTHEDA